MFLYSLFNRFHSELQHIEIRIGSVDQTGRGNEHLNENPLCFSFGPGNYDRMAYIDCATPLDGRFMTLQKNMSQYFELDDILICELLILNSTLCLSLHLFLGVFRQLRSSSRSQRPELLSNGKREVG